MQTTRSLPKVVVAGGGRGVVAHAGTRLRAEDRMEAFVGVQRIVEEIVAEMLASGEEPPVAIADKHYSGKFQVRVPEEVHRRLAIRAAEQGVSLNALASSRLACA